jgi:alkylation response protein AidB-like acyl-CoA dehydrogenase
MDEEKILAKVRGLTQEILERANEIDREGKFPYNDLELLKREGFYALSVPRTYAGLGAGTRLQNAVYLEVAKANSSTSQILFTHNADASLVFEFGSEDQKKRFARLIVKNGVLIANASSEPGIHVFDWKTTAAKAKDGVTLSGTKHFCTGSEGAEFILTVAIVEGAESFLDGTIVCMVPLDSEGLSLKHDWNAMGQRGTASGTMVLDRVFVPAENVIGEPGAFLKQEPSLLGPVFQSALSSIYTGIAEGAFEVAVKYVKTETRPWPTSGVKTPVDDPYIQRHFGEMRVKIEAAKLLVEKAGLLIDQARNGLATRGQASLATEHAKVASTEAALDVTSRIFQVCGARSTYARFGLDRYWRDARTLTLHDPVDRKLQEIGLHDLTGTEPPVSFYS